LVIEALAVEPGYRVLDAGCGPGFYCQELSPIVGRSGAVVGVDPAPAMLEAAGSRCRDLDNVSFLEGNVLALPVERHSFDRAVCVQVLEYVDDVVAALAELREALRPGGRLVVWDFDWTTVSWHASDQDLMSAVLSAWDQHLSHPALPRTLAKHMRSAGFEEIDVVAHGFSTLGQLDEGSYPQAAMPLIGRYVTSNQLMSTSDVDAWIADQQELSARGEAYFTCVQVSFSAIASG
jgi:ubiquinone/menaquinone biosynthesis C-methylase UbiE